MRNQRANVSYFRRHMKLFTINFSRMKNVKEKILLFHHMQKTSFCNKKLFQKNYLVFTSFYFVFCYICNMITSSSRFYRLLFASYNSQSLMIKNIAFSFFSNSFSYMKRNSSKEIWAENKAIDRNVWRLRFANVYSRFIMK